MRFHYVVRGIIFVVGKVLLVREKGAANTFLPGGHVESGERAESALLREIEEEIGKRAIVKRFVGAVENTWSENGRDNHEINLLFEVAVQHLDSSVPPPSREAHLEFLWVEPAELATYNLQPHPLVECLLNWRSAYNGFWGSSVTEQT